MLRRTNVVGRLTEMPGGGVNPDEAVTGDGSLATPSENEDILEEDPDGRASTPLPSNLKMNFKKQ